MCGTNKAQVFALALWLLAAAVAPTAAASGPHASPAAAAPSPNSAPPATGTGVQCNALDYFVQASGGKLPDTPETFRSAIEKIGRIKELGFPFSDAKLEASLSSPRVVIAVHPKSFHYDAATGAREAGPRDPNLYGRLFFAVNLHWDPKARRHGIGSPEFIAWNERDNRFDFGFIDGFGSASARVRYASRAECTRCHLTGGPIFPDFNWTNSVSNPAVREALKKRLHELDPNQFSAPDSSTRIAGVRPLGRHGAGDLHAATVYANRILLLNQLPSLIADPGNRRTILQALVAGAIAGKEPSSDWIDARFPAGPLDLSSLSAARSPLVNDNDPVAISVPRTGKAVKMPEGKPNDVNRILAYNRLREAGLVRLPADALPSTPGAFSPSERTEPLQRPSELFQSRFFAEAIGLTKADQQLLDELLGRAATLARHSMPTAESVEAQKASLLAKALSAPPFPSFFTAGRLPGRDELKRDLVLSLNRLLKDEYHSAQTLQAPDRQLLSRTPCDAPVTPPPATVTAAAPPHACARCHLGAKARERLRFPVDPFDPVQRTTWARTADPQKAAKWLRRLREHLFDLQDMPPADSVEVRLAGSPEAKAALASLKRFVDRELGGVSSPSGSGRQ